MGNHLKLSARKCAQELCSAYFEPTTRSRGQRYCSRSCSARDKFPSRKGVRHSEETKAQISRSRTGKAVGHPFWGNLEALAAAGRKSGELRRKVRELIDCARPDCDKTFPQNGSQPNKMYCSISCARKVDGGIGERSRNRTPAEGSGRCKWYNFRSSLNAETVRVQGSWELRVAHCLDTQGLPWRTNHNRDRFPYTDINGVERTYSPDFWQDGTYVEVKGYADPATRHKLAQVQAQGVPLKVLYWEDIKALETELFGKPLGGTNASQRLIRELTHG